MAVSELVVEEEGEVAHFPAAPAAERFTSAAQRWRNCKSAAPESEPRYPGGGLPFEASERDPVPSASSASSRAERGGLMSIVGVAVGVLDVGADTKMGG